MLAARAAESPLRTWRSSDVESGPAPTLRARAGTRDDRRPSRRHLRKRRAKMGSMRQENQTDGKNARDGDRNAATDEDQWRNERKRRQSAPSDASRRDEEHERDRECQQRDSPVGEDQPTDNRRRALAAAKLKLCGPDVAGD